MSHYNDDSIDPQDALEHPVGLAIGHAARSGSKGAIVGSTIGLGVSHLAGGGFFDHVRGAGIGALAGLGLGAAHGVMQAQRERNFDAMQLGAYKSASRDAAFEAGRSYAHILVKQAFTPTIDKGVGYAASGVTAGIGKILQAVGHAGKGIEDYATKKMDHEVAGKIVGTAGVLGAGAYGATHTDDIANAMGVGNNNQSQMSPYYPSQF